MDRMRDVVITGMGVVSPIGIGNDAYWQSLAERRSGVTALTQLGGRSPVFRYGGVLQGFDGKQFVNPRKALKVMCSEIQTAYAAAVMAVQDARLDPPALDRDRLGVVMGTNMYYCEPTDLVAAFRGCHVDGRFDFSRWGERSTSDIYPLWMLKHLPNMAACQIGIVYDARGHNNSIVLNEVGGLLALVEAANVIERGWADVMIAGGTGSRLGLTPMIYRGDVQLSHDDGDPSLASRPFDARREGLVNGEGAGVVILESRSHAESRGAEIRARLLGHGRCFGGDARGATSCSTGAERSTGIERSRVIERSIAGALRSAGLAPRDVGFVCAHGLGTIEDDPLEAQAIRAVLNDAPVTALKSYFGNLGAGSAVVELIGGLLGLAHGAVPVTLNYEQPDPACPVNVVHAQPVRPASSVFVSLCQARTGQAVAIAIGAP